MIKGPAIYRTVSRFYQRSGNRKRDNSLLKKCNSYFTTGPVCSFLHTSWRSVFLLNHFNILGIQGSGGLGRASEHCGVSREQCRQCSDSICKFKGEGLHYQFAASVRYCRYWWRWSIINWWMNCDSSTQNWLPSLLFLKLGYIKAEEDTAVVLLTRKTNMFTKLVVFHVK